MELVSVTVTWGRVLSVCAVGRMLCEVRRSTLSPVCQSVITEMTLHTTELHGTHLSDCHVGRVSVCVSVMWDVCWTVCLCV